VSTYVDIGRHISEVDYGIPMTNSRYGRGLILAITTSKSLKVKDKEIYYVQLEKNPSTRYRVNFEEGTCTCGDFRNRGETCKHFYKIVMERAIA
jgi:hypothetical protein